ncbi:protein of unknown function [Methanoculleus bourgensis]|uniref:Uncharacterized protein n=1 Tax=Methanoculleus bourgensis TaxID=83986 RepID=A0A0X3BL59_9EURY|nr:protein of unknown function [Methanoculleus bourgensis]
MGVIAGLTRKATREHSWGRARGCTQESGLFLRLADGAVDRGGHRPYRGRGQCVAIPGKNLSALLTLAIAHSLRTCVSIL